MTKLLTFGMAVALLVCPHAYGNSCGSLMASLGELAIESNSAPKNTHIYLTLLKHLARDKNALSSVSLQKIIGEKTTPDPMKYISDALSIEDKFTFNKAFASLRNIDWESARKEIRTLVEEMEGVEVKREGAKKTRNSF